MKRTLGYVALTLVLLFGASYAAFPQWVTNTMTIARMQAGAWTYTAIQSFNAGIDVSGSNISIDENQKIELNGIGGDTYISTDSTDADASVEFIYPTGEAVFMFGEMHMGDDAQRVGDSVFSIYTAPTTVALRNAQENKIAWNGSATETNAQNVFNAAFLSSGAADMSGEISGFLAAMVPSSTGLHADVAGFRAELGTGNASTDVTDFSGFLNDTMSATVGVPVNVYGFRHKAWTDGTNKWSFYADDDPAYLGDTLNVVGDLTADADAYVTGGLSVGAAGTAPGDDLIQVAEDFTDNGAHDGLTVAISHSPTGVVSGDSAGLVTSVVVDVFEAENFTGTLKGTSAQVTHFGTGIIDDVVGVQSNLALAIGNGTITTYKSFESVKPSTIGSGTITTGYGFYHGGIHDDAGTEYSFYAAEDEAHFGANVTIGDILSLAPKATAPATCGIGDFYVDTSGAACACTAANTWSNMTGTGACT